MEQAAPRNYEFAVSVYVRDIQIPDRPAVLLVKHRALGMWLPIGGRLTPGERPSTGARRKLRWETGIQDAEFSGEFGAHSSIPGTPKGFMGYEEHPAGLDCHMAFAFRMDIVGPHAIMMHESHEEHTWVSHIESTWRFNLAPNVRHLLAMALVIK